MKKTIIITFLAFFLVSCGMQDIRNEPKSTSGTVSNTDIDTNVTTASETANF